MANSAASQIIGYIENITKIDSSSIGIGGLEPTMLLNVIDKANREYYNKFILGGGEPKLDRTAETGGTIYADTTLDGALTTASTSIILDSVTGYATSGAGVVWDNDSPDFVEYTAISTLTLTGVTGIDYAHEDADAFSVLYALPSNFESFRSSHDSLDGVEVDGVPYRYTSGIPHGAQFSLYDNGTTKYIFFPRGLTGEWFARYNKGATAITTTASVIDVPIADEDFVVYRGVEHVYRVLNVDQNKVIEANQMANKIILDSLKRRNIGKRLKSGRPFMVGGFRRGAPASEYVNQFVY